MGRAAAAPQLAGRRARQGRQQQRCPGAARSPALARLPASSSRGLPGCLRRRQAAAGAPLPGCSPARGGRAAADGSDSGRSARGSPVQTAWQRRPAWQRRHWWPRRERRRRWRQTPRGGAVHSGPPRQGHRGCRAAGARAGHCNGKPAAGGQARARQLTDAHAVAGRLAAAWQAGLRPHQRQHCSQRPPQDTFCNLRLTQIRSLPHAGRAPLPCLLCPAALPS
jgi:hypothetical protein